MVTVDLIDQRTEIMDFAETFPCIFVVALSGIAKRPSVRDLRTPVTAAPPRLRESEPAQLQFVLVSDPLTRIRRSAIGLCTWALPSRRPNTERL